MTEAISTEALYEALEKGNHEEFKSLLKKNSKPIDSFFQNGMTLLMQAAYQGDVDICRHLIESGASVNATQHENHYTALMMAALAGKLETVQLLLDLGADINDTNSIGKTAIQLASFVGQHEAANLMKNYLSLDKLQPYVESQGGNSPRISKSAAEAFHKFVALTNPHPLKIVLFIMDHEALYSLSGLKQADTVFSDLMRKCVRSNSDFDEILAIKLYHFSSIVSLCIEHMNKRNTDKLDLLLKKILHSDGDGFQVAVETLIRKSFLSFPYPDFPLIQQFVKTIHPVKIGSNPTSMSCLISMFTGMHSASQRQNVCEACSENASPLRCSACKAVCYCSKRCQKLHWFVHKKFCKKS